MSTLTIQQASLRTGLSGPTLRYYEEVGLIGPIPRDDSGHRRYTEHDIDDLQALACLRAMGVGIGDMRSYQSNRALGTSAAGEQRDLLRRHAARIEAEIETLKVHLEYLHAKAALWEARAAGEAADEARASLLVQEMLPRLQAVLR